MRNILLSVILSLPFLLNAQVETSKDFSYKISKPYQVIDGKRKVYFYKENQILSVKVIAEDVFIQKINSSEPALIKTNKEKLPENAVVESIIEFNNKYYFFYSLWDRPNKNEQLFYREINFENGKFEASTTKIITVNHHLSRIPIDNIIGFWGHGISNKFHFKMSGENSKLLIQYRYLREKRIDAINFDITGICVFNQDVEPIWNKEVKMPYTEKQMNFHDNWIDSKGNVFILATVYEDNRNHRREIPELEILKYQADSDTLFDLSGMDLNGKLITGIKFSESSKNQISFTGFYSEDPIQFQSNGLFMLDMDKKGNSRNISFFEFPNNFFVKPVDVQNYNTDLYYTEPPRPEMSDYKIVEKKTNKDGSVTILSEQQFIETITTYSKTGRHENHTYYYSDIVITKIDTDGKTQWMKKIQKDQFGYKGKGTMSFKYLSNDIYHYILFFDTPDNLDEQLDAEPYTYQDKKEAILFSYKISDINGEITKLPVLETESFNGLTLKQFYSDRIVILENNEFILEAYKKKKEDVLVKVRLSE
ncbi:MAG: hypothetical protein K8R31_15205 [Bacteroidales bacterium]|nr:hypothetical protein [Bacteroidales bacterium]